jgi:hypothetical protein
MIIGMIVDQTQMNECRSLYDSFKNADTTIFLITEFIILK